MQPDLMMTFRDHFTADACRVLEFAESEARKFGHNYIGTEHLLLGLINDRAAAATLDELGAPTRSVRKLVEDIIDTDPHGRSSPDGPIPYSGRARRTVEELVPREVLNLGHNYIDTAHLLLGLIREGEGVAAEVLGRLGVNLTQARRHIATNRKAKR
jgi:ATP-dependent Clp protease ATP-binding subunit ClpC